MGVQSQPRNKKHCFHDYLEFEKEILNLSAKMPKQNIYYLDKYEDENLEYSHVMLPKDLAKMVPKSHLMSETEWRSLGVQQSQGWIHYMTHDPEPHILLFKRSLSIYGQNAAVAASTQVSAN